MIGGDCVELGEGELPYAPIVGALRPLARSGAPGLRRAVRARPRARSPRSCPASAHEARADDEATAQARLFDGLLELLELLAGEDGLLLTIEDLHWADRSTRAFLVYLAALAVPRARAGRHDLPARTSCTAATRCARCSPSSSATRAPAASSCGRSPATELAEQLTRHPRRARRGGDLLARLFARSEGNPLFAEELLAAGTDGRGVAPADAARRADAADRAALRRTRRSCCGVLAAGQPAGPRDPRRRPPASIRALRERCARPSPRSSSSPTTRAATRSATRCCARSWSTTCCPASARDCISRSRARWSARAEGLPGHGGAHLAAGIAHHYLASGDQPTALAASVRAAEAAEAVHANGEAAALYSRALQLWDRVADAEALAGRDHVELLRAAAWTTGREHEPARAETYLRAALHRARRQRPGARRRAARARRPPAVQPGPLAPRPPRRAASALALLPEGPSGTRATLLAERRQGADARVAPPGGGRGRRGGARGRPRRRRRGRRAARAGRAWASSLFGLGPLRGGRAGAARGARAHARATACSSVLHTHVNLADSLAVAGRLAEAREIADEGDELAARARARRGAG